MDQTLISGKEAVEDKVPDNDTSGKGQPEDVEMEETKRDSPSRTAEPDEANEELAERLRPDSVPEDGDNLCLVCGFSAKCPRSLKIHFARKHGKNSKNTNRTAKPAEKSDKISDVSPAEIQQEVDMETESAVEVKQNQESDLDELTSAASDNAMNTNSLNKKETVSDNQQADQEEAIPSLERRVSKRTPKPKMIYSCNYCGQEFRDKSPLDVHIKRSHTKDIPYTFDADEDMDGEKEAEDPGSTPKAPTSARVAAKRTFSRFQLKCSNCDFRVSTPALLENHTRLKHLNQEWYRCKLCNFLSATSEWMDAHLSSDSHMEQQKSTESASFEVYVESVSRDGACDAAAVDDVAQVAGGEAVATSTEEHQETDEADEAAKAVLNEEEDLDLESPRKKRGRPKQGSTTTCGYCGLVVSNATNLSVHVRRKHSKEYGYSCTLCNYSCVTKGDMDRHCITKKHVKRAQECANKNPVNNHTSASQQEPTTTRAQEPNAASQTTDNEPESDNTASNEHSGEEQTQSDSSQKKSKYDSVNACSHCDFVAQSIPSLHLHVKRKHTKDFEYVCLACSYYAVTSREMSRHANTEKHKQKSQKYLEPLGSEGQRALALPLKLKEVIELVGANSNPECEHFSPTEESDSCSDDGQAMESQNTAAASVTAEPVDAVVSVAGSADEKQAEITSSSSDEPDPTNETVVLAELCEAQQSPAELQPAVDQSAQQENQEEEEEGKQADEEHSNADEMILEAKTDSCHSDTQMSKAPPFDACILSMKALAEQEQELQEGLALEGEAAVICLTGGSPVPSGFSHPNSAYVKKLKRKEIRVREEAKGSSPRIRCEDCGFMADGISGLNVHISMKHPSKEKHFHCLVCGKSFYTESNLHQHLTSAAHLRNEQNSVETLPEGGASFKCVKCTDRFESEQELFVHIKEKHEELLREVNKYVVEDTEQINREREENQGSVCKYCGKVCKSSNSMAFLAHIRTHTASEPPAAAVTTQAVEGLVNQCVQREVSRLHKSLDELAQEHKKALEDNSSLRRTVGELGRELARLREDNRSVRRTLRRMAKRVNPSDQNCEQRLLTPSPQTPACCSRCAQPQSSPHLPSSLNGESTQTSTEAVRTRPSPIVLPNIVLQTVDPEVEDNIFRNTKHGNGRRRPDDYAAKMFMMIVDFSTYRSWEHTVNWTGSDGKQALPRNVILKLKEFLQHRYKDISVREWKEIRNRVNERLRKSRKMDPRRGKVHRRKKRVTVHPTFS
ncbi:uncharacterized protein znf407 isoform X2 [Sebastes fasciatus]|uniref:uncharacterized protein znf407 isoform X2 n=1 Tax=Sebastes fasciatus TaxID=394691 RepID=UPI003D9EC7F4